MGMTASLHKLTAGTGYDYLTRQVAAHDSTEKGHATLDSYYSERGEVPGAWRGRGVAGLGDLAVGDVVTAEQMLALFGGGFHPNMKARLSGLPDDATPDTIDEASRLGKPFMVFKAASEFRLEVEQRTAAWRTTRELAASVPVPVDVRAGIVNDVAAARFEERMGRAPSTRELSGEVARWSRQPLSACAGYDVTFTPVKSVSALWALAAPEIAAGIQRAHDAAVDDALRYLEDHALFSRAGIDGVRQIDVHGLVAASFTHRDSRAGDPNLHTHVAIANKIQGLDGKWRAIDGRLLYQARVSISETYNTQLEAHLRDALGLEFVERIPTNDRRPVREVAGVPPKLLALWSSRRAHIEARQAVLAAEFQARHSRPPTPAEAIRLAQQATLETREAKHAPRSLAAQRATWRREAESAIGDDGITRMLAASLGRTPSPSRPAVISEQVLDRVAREVVDRVARDRASWQVWHLRGEASRRARQLAASGSDAEALTQQLLDRALAASIPLSPADDDLAEPHALRRADGTSMYEVAGSRRYTSPAVLDAEHQILSAADRADGRRIDEPAVELALLESVANGISLTDGQARLVRAMATSGARVQLALAPAGTGKTTAMRVLARAWEEAGGTVVGLAPSAVATATLGEEISQTTTIAKLLHDQRAQPANTDAAIGPSTLVIVDEAGMTDTLTLAEFISYALSRGASIRLIGDDQQLAAIGAGGVLRDLQRSYGAIELDAVLRFTDDGEKAASLALRDGDPAALGWYLDHDRIHAGSPETALEATVRSWHEDSRRALETIMLATTRQEVAELNRRAQTRRVGILLGPTVELSDGNVATVDDVILTRRNDRRLGTSHAGWVKNGDRWSVERVHVDGSLEVRHRRTGGRALLPAWYVAAHVELGYASTVHSAQGITVDATHTLLTGTESRQQLYVAMTRGRSHNHVYVPVVGTGDEHTAFRPETLRPPTAIDMLDAILARDGTARSVTTQLRDATAPAVLLPDAVNRYRDAITVALEHHHAAALDSLDRDANTLLPGLTDCDAWPTLRQRLLTSTDTGDTPIGTLHRIATGYRWNDGIRDPAALLASLLPEHSGGPLPWLPPIPQILRDDECWGPYLQARADRVATIAAQVRADALQAPLPPWLPAKDHIPAKTIADVHVWRAAEAIPDTDRRPTGEPLQAGAARRHQIQLDQQLVPSVPTFGVAQLRLLGQGVADDPTTADLALLLARLEARGFPVAELTSEALRQGPLPSERPAAALTWRIAELAKSAINRDRDAADERRWRHWAEQVNPTLTGTTRDCTSLGVAAVARCASQAD